MDTWVLAYAEENEAFTKANCKRAVTCLYFSG